MGVYALRRLGRKIRDDNLWAERRLSGFGGQTAQSRHSRFLPDSKTCSRG